MKIEITVENRAQVDHLLAILSEAEVDGRIGFPFGTKVDGYDHFVVDDEDEDHDEDYHDYDDSMDGDHESAFASCGWGVDESYGCYGEEF